MLSIWISLKICCLVKSSVTFNLSSANALNLVTSKILSFGKGLKAFFLKVGNDLRVAKAGD